MENEKKEEIYSNKILCGSRTYFFDVKQTRKGDYYFKISEKRKMGETIETHQLMIFNEDIDKFAEAFQRTLEELRKVAPEPTRRFSNERTSFERFGGNNNYENRDSFRTSWSFDEIERLRELWEQGKTEEEIAETLGRPVGAIVSQARKMNLTKEG